MKYLSRKPLSAVTLGAIVLPIVAAAFVATPEVQADPPSHAPAYGYRNKGNKNKKNRGDRDYDNDGIRNRHDRDDDNDGIRDRRDRDDDNDGVRDYRDGDDDNDGIRDRRERDRARRERERRDRDRDGIPDYRDNNYNNGNGNNGQRITFGGIVTRDIGSDRRFTVRADDNRTYRVLTQSNEPRRLSVGDRVRVSGYVSGNTRDGLFRADSVQIVNNRDGNYGGNYNGGQRINFVATVLSNNNGIMRVRGDNGQTYRVRWHEVKVGGRVRIQGRFVNGIVQADSVVYA